MELQVGTITYKAVDHESCEGCAFNDTIEGRCVFAAIGDSARTMTRSAASAWP